MKENTKCVLFNKTDSLTTCNKEEQEHLYSDALVIHKSGSNYLLTIHGDRTEEIHDTIDGNIDYISGHRDYYANLGMYKINSVDAKILSNTSPDSFIFKGVLNAIRKRQNLMKAELDVDAKKIRDSVITSGKKAALSKQIEEGILLKQERERNREKKEQMKRQSTQRIGAKASKLLSDFLNSGKDI